MTSWSPPPGPGPARRTWPPWPRRSTPGPCPRTRRTRPAAELRGPAGAGGDHVRRGGRHLRGPHPGMRRGGDRGAGRAVGPGGARRTPGPRTSAITMRWKTRCAAWWPAGLLPERAGQPVKVWAHVSLAELRALDDGSVLAQEWVGEMAVRWAARRAAASQAGSDGAAWLDGKPARALACDARSSRWSPAESTPAPWMTWWPCACSTPATARTAAPAGPGQAGSDRRRRGTPRTRTRLTRQASPAARRRPGQPADPPAGPPRAGPGRAPPAPARGRPPPRGRRCSGTRSSAGPSTWSPAPAGSPASCGPGCRAPGWPGPACRWTSGTAPRSPPRSAARSSCAISTAAGPAAATSPPRPVKSTTSPTWPTAAPPASDGCALYCFFHHHVAIHQWGWTVALHPDGTTTARSPDGTKILRSHAPP